jgi:putative ABC transport system permease protein
VIGAALRNLGRAPAFTGLVILTLALGIGAATAMFSVVDSVLMNVLPFPNADRLGEIGTVSEMDGRAATTRSTTATLQALRRETTLFTAVEAYTFGTVNVLGGGDPEIVAAPRVTPGLLTMVGVQPALGRLFTDEDTAVGRVAILSDAFWAARFGADPNIVGRDITLDDEPFRVIGVMPRSFRFPEANVRIWLPLDAAPAKPGRANVIVMRRPELTTTQVNDRLKAMSSEWRAAGIMGQTDSLSIDILLQQRFGRQSGQALYTLFGAVALVLLVACVNVMNLMLVRASGRAGELAMMTALGASATSLVRGVLVESALLAAAGCVAGLALAQGLLRLILAAAPPNLTFLAARADLDWRGWGFAVAIAVATCVVCGLLPALRAARNDTIEVLKQRTSRVSAADDWWQGALVAAQLSLVLLLLTGSGLLLRSFDRLVRVDPGFAVDELAVLEVQLPPHRYGAPGAEMTFMRDLEQRVEARTGVATAISGGAPPTGGGFSFNLTPEVDDRGPVDFSGVTLPFGTVAPDYFETMGIPIVAGRVFTADDGAEAIVINDVMARRLWGDVSPIGRRIRLSEKRPWYTVVGVAADVKQMGPSDPMGGMEFYQPLTMTARNSFYAFIMRSTGDRERLLQAARQVVWDIDPKLPIVETATMEGRIGEAIARPRFYLTLSSAFALSGLLLAAIGVYGVSAYWVSRRRRELAIRLALGASRRNVINMVIGRSARLAAIGAAAGLTLAIAGARAIEAMLFQTDSRDPATLVMVTLVLAGLVVAGCIGPAMKAARVDPMTTLRAE